MMPRSRSASYVRDDPRARSRSRSARVTHPMSCTMGMGYSSPGRDLDDSSPGVVVDSSSSDSDVMRYVVLQGIKGTTHNLKRPYTF
jgi:hypothetical protein